MIGDFLGDIAIFVSVIGLVMRTRLSVAVFLYLMTWLIADWVLIVLGSYYIFPAIFIGVAIDYLFINYLYYFNVRCVITPIVIAFSAIYGSLCLYEDYVRIYVLYDYYGLVMGVTALLVALEAVYDGALHVGPPDFSRLRGALSKSRTVHRHQKGKEA